MLEVSVTDVSFDEFRMRPAHVVDTLKPGASLTLTYRGEPLATIKRSCFAADYGDGVVDVSVRDWYSATLDRAEALKGGARFTVTRHGRRIAVVEGR